MYSWEKMIFQDDLNQTEERWREALDSHYKDAEYQELLQSRQSVVLAPGARKILNGRLFVAPPSGPLHLSSTKGQHGLSERSSLYQRKSILRTNDPETEESTLIPGSGTVDHNPIYEAYEGFRFPPAPKLPIPRNVRVEDFILPDMTVIDNCQRQSKQVNQSIILEECYAGLRFLEAMLKTFAMKTMELRTSIIEHADYLYNLTRPPADTEDAQYIETTIFTNFATLYEELQELLTEMNVFQATKIHEMIDTSSEIFEDNEPIYQLKDSLITRSNRLCDEVSLSTLAIEQLVDYANSLIRFPSKAIPMIEGFHTDWEELKLHYKKVSRNVLSQTFLCYMMKHGFPVCEAVYSYLQAEPEVGHNHSLIITNYQFSKGEFKQIMMFLRIQDQLFASEGMTYSIMAEMKELVISHSSFTDPDFHALVSSLHKFVNLKILNVSHNSVSYSGIASFATNVFDHSSRLSVLILDHNRINCDGAMLLGQVMKFMPLLRCLSLSFNPIGDKGCYGVLKYSLNHKRKKFLTLPKFQTRKGGKSGKSGNGDEEDKDYNDSSKNKHEEDDEEDEEEEEEDQLGGDRHAGRRRYPFRCYFQDYFERIIVPEDTQDDDSKNGGIGGGTNVLDFDWVNHDDEEFDMEVASEYSEQEDDKDIQESDEEDDDFDDDDFDEEDEGGGKSGKKPPVNTTTIATQKRAIREAERERRAEEKRFLSLSYKEKLEYGDPVLQAQRLRDEKLLQQLQQQSNAADVISKYPKLVQVLLKNRLKLIAIAMFQSLRLRGCSDLMAIRLAGCGLTENVLPTMATCLIDNQLVRDVSIAHNQEMLSSIAACKFVSDILELGNITALDLSNTGLREGGLMMIAKAMEKSRQLRRIDLSENRLGPTAANIVANLHKQFYADVIRIAPGHFKSAPFLHRDLFATSPSKNYGMDWDDDNDLNPIEALKRKKRRNRRAWLQNRGSMRRSGNQQSDESESDASSFVDNDIFDGDEDETAVDDDSVSAISKGMELL